MTILDALDAKRLRLMTALTEAGGEWSRARQLANEAKLPYSTITQYLREFAAAGLAESVNPVVSGDSVRWRLIPKRQRDEAPSKTAESKTRPSTAGTKAAFGRGKLQDAILALFQEAPDPQWQATPHAVAKLLNAHTGAVAYGMAQMVRHGSLKQVADRPKTYAAV